MAILAVSSNYDSFVEGGNYLSTEKTLAIFPIARILFLITSFLRLAAAPANMPLNQLYHVEQATLHLNGR